MPKKLSASSRPAALGSEDIRNNQWSEKQRQVLRLIAKFQTSGDDSGIDYSDIPRLREAQLAGMTRLRDVRRA